MFAPLRQRNFALLWVGGLVSVAGDRVLIVILPFYVYQHSHSTMAMALMVTTELLPRFLLGSLAGVVVDRWDRRRIMLAASLLQAVAVLLLLLVESQGWLWMVYVAGLLQTVISTFFEPAESALLPRLVSEDLLLPANALNALNNNLARLAGPPLGGAVFALTGLAGVVVLDSLSFLFAALMIALATVQAGAPAAVRANAPGVDRVETVWGRFGREWAEGLAYVRGNRLVWRLFWITVLINLGGVMIDPLFAPFVSDILHAGPQTYGWILAMRAAGGILGGLLVGRLGQRLHHPRAFAWATLITGVLIGVEFNIPRAPVMMATVFAIGLPTVVVGAALDTLFQRIVPDNYLGRVFGLLGTVVSVVSISGVLGLGGALSSLIGIVPVLNISAFLTILSGGLALAFLPSRTAPASGLLAERQPE